MSINNKIVLPILVVAFGLMALLFSIPCRETGPSKVIVTKQKLGQIETALQSFAIHDTDTFLRYLRGTQTNSILSAVYNAEKITVRGNLPYSTNDAWGNAIHLTISETTNENVFRAVIWSMGRNTNSAATNDDVILESTIRLNMN